ncbi:MAG: hypothetical protein ACKOQ6_09585 [Bacteroidota bacterium]
MSGKQLLLIVPVFVLAQYCSACSIEDIRSRFAKAAEDEKTAAGLLETLKNCPQKSALITGYIGATEALMGKHAFMPTSKYSWCKKSETDFNSAVIKDSENLEIRYLRFAVESNLPSFLNMSKHVDEDKSKMIQLINSSNDKTINRKVARLLLDSKMCTKPEEAQLKRHLD